MKYSPFRHLGSVLWKRTPIQLTLFLTSRCNARCPFCFYLSRPRQDNLEELSLGELAKISSSVGNLLWLAFSGGEIFLRDDLLEITRLFYRNNKPAIILLPTNGLIPKTIYRNTEAILKSCPNSVVTVKLSLDGPEELHDSLRGVEGAYSKMIFCYETLAGLLDKYDNFELGINTVFCAANQDKMAETIELVAGLDKIKTHTISLIRGEVLADDLKEVSMAKYQAAIGMLEANMKKSRHNGYNFVGAGLKTAQDILQRRLIYETATKKEQLIPCQAGKLTAVVTETGDVYPCESFQDKLGNLRNSDYDLPQILGSEKGRLAMAAIKNNKCYCTHECYMIMNILFNPGQYPALFREYARLQAGSSGIFPL
jgi:radical SAM protein with 4Fe4S-binding SPASM domain